MALIRYISLSLFLIGILSAIFAPKISKLLGLARSKLVIWFFRIGGILVACLSIVVLLFSLLFLVYPGDYFFSIHGTVYEWIDAPGSESSKILFGNELPEGIDVKPIEGASINLYWVSIEDGEKIIHGSSPFSTTYTDSSGNFSSHEADPSPGAGNYHVKVMKEGFIEASEFLLHEDGTDYEMTVIMVRKDR